MLSTFEFFIIIIIISHINKPESYPNHRFLSHHRFYHFLNNQNCIFPYGSIIFKCDKILTLSTLLL